MRAWRRGWLSPWIAESRTTPDLLAEAGHRYTRNWCMDDQPIWLKTRAGRLLAIPYPQEANDIPAIVGRKGGAGQFAAMVLAEFEERLEQVGRDGVPQAMGIALHPYIIAIPTGCGRGAGRLPPSRRGEARSGSPPPAACWTMWPTLPEGAVP